MFRTGNKWQLTLRFALSVSETQHLGMIRQLHRGRWNKRQEREKERDGLSCWRSWDISIYIYTHETAVVMEINLIKIRNSENLVEAGSSLGFGFDLPLVFSLPCYSSTSPGSNSN